MFTVNVMRWHFLETSNSFARTSVSKARVYLWDVWMKSKALLFYLRGMSSVWFFRPMLNIIVLFDNLFFSKYIFRFYFTLILLDYHLDNILSDVFILALHTPLFTFLRVFFSRLWLFLCFVHITISACAIVVTTFLHLS